MLRFKSPPQMEFSAETLKPSSPINTTRTTRVASNRNNTFSSLSRPQTSRTYRKTIPTNLNIKRSCAELRDVNQHFAILVQSTKHESYV